MSRVYFHPETNAPLRFPFGKEAAKQVQQRIYISAEVCPICNTGQTAKYVASDKCTKCAQLEAGEFFNYMFGFVYLDTQYDATGEHMRVKWHTLPKYMSNREIHWSQKILFEREGNIFQGQKPSKSADEASRTLLALWVQPEPCPKGGHLGIRMADGKCFTCEREKLERKHVRAQGKQAKPLSHRQKAIQERKDRYWSETPCKTCGNLSERRVNNGACLFCEILRSKAFQK